MSIIKLANDWVKPMWDDNVITGCGGGAGCSCSCRGYCGILNDPQVYNDNGLSVMEVNGTD